MKELATRGEKWARKNGRSPYDVMDLEDIANLPIQSIAADNCVLFLWATHPKLEEAFYIIKKWGFTYKTVAFTWVKQTPLKNGWHFGLGYWTRQNPELCLLATKGRPKRVNASVANLVISPLGRHSRKPDEVRRRIVELMGDLPRIELFCTEDDEHTEDWTIAGDAVDGMDIRESLKIIANWESDE